MNALTLRPRTERERIDWDSLFLLLMLIVPAAVMWIILILWPGVVWMAPTLHTAIEALGSFTLLLLAVFFIARYRGRPGTLFISAGLGGMAVLAGFLMAAAPSSNEYAWLNSISGIVGGALFLYATVTSYRSIPTGIGKRAWWLLGGSAGLAFAAGLCTIIFSRLLPPMMSGTRFTGIAWTVNALPIALFLVTGIGLFAMYRRTAERGLFVFASIVVFLFQAREVYYLAAVWTPVWWFWQGLCLAVYFCVLFFVLKGYIKTSDSLTGEIVERRRVEDALRAAEQDWRNSFNSIDDIMVIIDRDFVIQRINETGLRQLGREPGLVIGQKCPRLFHGLDRPPKDCPCRSSFRSGKVATMEQTDKHSGRAFAVKGAPICTESKPEKCVCLMRDITKEIKARDKERELQQELNTAGRLASIGEVAAGIAHEINNPLTGVIGFAQMLSGMVIPSEMREAVEVIQDGATRTAAVVEKLLAFARRSKSKREYVDINTVLQSTIDIRAYESRVSDVEIHTALAPDLPRTMANFGQLQQVFLNLVVNAEQAIAAAKRPGRINVKTEVSRNVIRVTVQDNGIGIPQGNMGKLFDPFFTTRADSGGTGLGLSISYGIIKEHRGSIKVRSTPDVGTTFTVDIPIVAESPAGEVVAAPVPARPALRAASILVVDDEINICRILDRLLTKEGHVVDTVMSAQAALERVKTKTYDLVLMDLRMPGMSGIDLYAELKKLDARYENKVVFITGDFVSPKNREFLENTGGRYLPKPFTGEALLHSVNSTLGGE